MLKEKLREYKGLINSLQEENEKLQKENNKINKRMTKLFINHNRLCKFSQKLKRYFRFLKKRESIGMIYAFKGDKRINKEVVNWAF